MENLDDIKRAAEAGAQSAAPGAAADAAGAQLDQAALDKQEAEAWAEIPAAVGRILAVAMPELAEHYSDAACLAWGEQMRELAKRYGWTSKIVGPWVGLALATVPLAVPTYVAFKLRRQGASGRTFDAAGADVKGNEAAQAAAREAGADSRRPPRVAPIG